ncbi:hypothetical protein H9X85_06475 [Anaerotignum lactatifermentans]|uniref:Energy-coupling factor transport system substrate-specific component n=1 Tax=Anaerotignum lactatifermentans TaxID=160404 RepID=A0ABS2G8I5_9FIRM|nr:hypothetical protein [Anaerotignum lactatifermentans]MBM6829283.1 hypothetical protein [Anaerotignum lactatifermentans]MBM6877477.1 hypothetical protein [Anaerotignum lactatifermentans]MBM6950861.1 hypothetical protein [Anaerotignum lactatifermentans]
MNGKPILRLTQMGLMTAFLFLGQVLLSFLPNIELVSLLILLYTLCLGRKVFLVIYCFVFLEGFLYGFGIWWFSYLYVWSILAALVYFFRKNDSALFWAILSGFFGLAFGALCALPYLAAGGWAAAFSYWVSGLGFDLVHCAGNFVLTLILYRPLRALLARFFSAA